MSSLLALLVLSSCKTPPKDKDSDGDGVPDRLDRCPDREIKDPDVRIGPDGCPMVFLSRDCPYDSKAPVITFADLRAKVVYEPNPDEDEDELMAIRLGGLVDVDDDCPTWKPHYRARFRVVYDDDSPADWTDWAPCAGMGHQIGACQISLRGMGIEGFEAVKYTPILEANYPDIETEVVVRVTDGAANTGFITAEASFATNQCLTIRYDLDEAEPLETTASYCDEIGAGGECPTDGTPPVLDPPTPYVDANAYPYATFGAAVPEGEAVYGLVALSVSWSVEAEESGCGATAPEFGATVVARVGQADPVELSCVSSKEDSPAPDIYTAIVTCSGSTMATVSKGTSWTYRGWVFVEDGGLNISQSELLEETLLVGD